MNYQGADVTGITPEQWVDFQALTGDSVDNIGGALGIGPAVSVPLIKKFGTLDAVIEAAANGTCGLSELKTAAILNFARDHAAVTMQLVKMRTDLVVPFTTRLV
jgi:DNA polymerase-1